MSVTQPLGMTSCTQSIDREINLDWPRKAVGKGGRSNQTKEKDHEQKQPR